MAEKNGFDLAAALGDVSKLDQKSGPLQFGYADIEDIHPSEFNSKVFTLSELNGLMESILLEGGLQQPLYVKKDGEGWRLFSGHRRHAAIRKLVAGDANNAPHPELRLVPICFRENQAAFDSATLETGTVLDADKTAELSRLMGELRVLIGNMGNRKLNPSELDRTAKQLEEHYAALAALGVRFPGRIRNKVAAACQVSESKLARLKVIREKLVPPTLVALWESGDMPEQSAYAIARMEPVMQAAVAKACPKKIPSGRVLERILENGMKAYLSRKCKCPSGEGCTNGARILSHDLNLENSWDVGHCVCCATCRGNKSCSYACPAGKQAGAETKKQEQEKKAQQEKERENRDAAIVKEISDFISRFVAVCNSEEQFNAIKKSLMKQNVAKSYMFSFSQFRESAYCGKGITSYRGYYVPDFSEIAPLCRELNCSADYLLGLTDDPRPNAEIMEAVKA